MKPGDQAMTFGMTTNYGKQVPRRGFPKPQTLTELGDKKQVLEFLMAEYMDVLEVCQRIDAPILARYLIGDNAVRLDRVADAFRNAFTMSALEKLYLAINNNVTYEADVANYQGCYDAIGDDADKVAQTYAEGARRWRETPLPLVLPEETHRVAVGDIWRHKAAPGVSHRVTKIEDGQAELSTSDPGKTGSMTLDKNGFCKHPELWKLFSYEEKNPPLPPNAAEYHLTGKEQEPSFRLNPGGYTVLSASRANVAVGLGQMWKLDGTPYRVIGFATAQPGGNVACTHARLSDDIHEEVYMSLDKKGFCEHPNIWELVPSLEDQMATVSALAKEPEVHSSTPTVAVGQCWKTRSGATLTVVEVSVDQRCARLVGERHAPDGGVYMMIDEQGRCASPAWTYLSPPKLTRRRIIEVGQIWRHRYDRSLIATVTGFKRLNEGGTHARTVALLGGRYMGIDEETPMREIDHQSAAAWDYVGDGEVPETVEPGQVWFNVRGNSLFMGRVLHVLPLIGDDRRAVIEMEDGERVSTLLDDHGRLVEPDQWIFLYDARWMLKPGAPPKGPVRQASRKVEAGQHWLLNDGAGRGHCGFVHAVTTGADARYYATLEMEGGRREFIPLNENLTPTDPYRWVFVNNIP